MKYWRGYVVALIAAACAWALGLFASSHQALIDAVYPYFSRLIQDILAQWSSSVSFCLWQLAVIIFIGAVLVTVVLMFVLHWNPVQVTGWVLAAVSCVNLFATGIFGLNKYAGSIREDLRLSDIPYSMSDLRDAMLYFRNEANTLSQQVKRDETGLAEFEDFQVLSQKAGKGFHVMAYERSASVLAGSLVPVKELGWQDYFTDRGITGMTVGLTGEAAVNPRVPDSMLPFAMCREMAHRMSIAGQADANFAAFLACEANPDLQFRYAAFLMAYGYCYDALTSFDTNTATEIRNQVALGLKPAAQADLDSCNRFTGKPDPSSAQVCNLLVYWHIEKVVLPSKMEQPPLFDPSDESQVDLSGIRAAAGN